MSDLFHCPSCAQAYNFKPPMAGREVKCQRCQTSFRVPAQADPPTTTPSAIARQASSSATRAGSGAGQQPRPAGQSGVSKPAAAARPAGQSGMSKPGTQPRPAAPAAKSSGAPAAANKPATHAPDDLWGGGFDAPEAAPARASHASGTSRTASPQGRPAAAPSAPPAAAPSDDPYDDLLGGAFDMPAEPGPSTLAPLARAPLQPAPRAKRSSKDWTKLEMTDVDRKLVGTSTTLSILGIGSLILPLFGLEFKMMRAAGDAVPVIAALFSLAAAGLLLFAMRKNLLYGGGAAVGIMIGYVVAFAISPFNTMLVASDSPEQPAAQPASVGKVETALPVQASTATTPTPGPAPAAPPVDNTPIKFTLANVKCTDDGNALTCTADYDVNKKTGGSDTFVWIVETPGERLEFEYRGHQLAPKGRLRGKVDEGLASTSSASAYIVDRSHLEEGVGTTVSNRVSVVLDVPAAAIAHRENVRRSRAEREQEEKDNLLEPVPRALAALKSGVSRRQHEALRELAAMEPTSEQDQVARALADQLKSSDTHVKKGALKALVVWHTDAVIPDMCKTVNDADVFTRWEAYETLSNVQDSRAADAIAERLTADRFQASNALQKMGPMAEPSVAKYLKHSDHWVRAEACKILGVIGTRKSIPELRRMTRDKNFFVSTAAKRAGADILARKPPASTKAKAKADES